MNILGIGPGELILILFLLLIVVGPERLPDLARQLAQLLVRVRNWIQHSPDAALVLRARQELEQELASIKASLLEVQHVQDELIVAARQFEDSVSGVGALLSPADLPYVAAAELDAQPPAGDPFLPQDIGRVAPEEAPDIPPAVPRIASASESLLSSQLEDLNVRLQAVMSDLWALQNQLRRSGVLSGDWQPPSYSMQLPDRPTHDTAATDPAAELPPAADAANQEAPDVIH